MSECQINKIVIFTMESLYSSLTMRFLIPAIKDKIALICLSDPYGGKHGGFIEQIKKNYRHSGLYFLNYLCVVFVYYLPVIYFKRFILFLVGKKSNFDTVANLARQNGIPVYISGDINNLETENFLKKVKPDLIVSYYFDQIIKENIFSLSQIASINVHPAILPDYRGPFPAFWALKNREEEVGFTVHYIDSKLDTGDIICQEKFAVPKNCDSVLGVDYEIFRRGALRLPVILKKIENKSIVGESQAGRGHYYSYPDKAQIIEAKGNGIKLFSLRDFFKYL